MARCSLLLLASTAFNFAALRWIGLATAAAINFTAPAMVALMAAWSLGERVSRRRWTAILVGFAGVLVVIGPRLDAAQLGAVFSVGTAVCYAGYQMLTRKVADGDPPETTVGYSALVGTVVASLLVPFVWVTPRSAAQALILASLGPVGRRGPLLRGPGLSTGPRPLSSRRSTTSSSWGRPPPATSSSGRCRDRPCGSAPALIVASGLSILLEERAGRAAPA